MEALIDSASSHLLTTPDWTRNLAVWDSLNVADPSTITTATHHLVKRLLSRSAQVQLLTLTLIDSLVSNGSVEVHRALSSKSFLDGLDRVIKGRTTNAIVKNKALEFLESWTKSHATEVEFDLMIEYQEKLGNAGIRYKPGEDVEEVNRKQRQKVIEDQNELLKREELELQQALLASTISNEDPEPQLRIPSPPIFVRALFDFISTKPVSNDHELELSFRTGDVIKVLDKAYVEWWKGEGSGGIGIFPINYCEVLEGYVEPLVVETVKPLAIEAPISLPVISAPVETAPPGIQTQQDDFTLRVGSQVERLMILMNSRGSREEVEPLYANVLDARPKIEEILHSYRDKIDELIDLQHRIAEAKARYHGIAPPQHPHFPQQPRFEPPAPVQPPFLAQNTFQHSQSNVSQRYQPNQASPFEPPQTQAEQQEQENWTEAQKIEWRDQWTRYREAEKVYQQAQLQSSTYHPSFGSISSPYQNSTPAQSPNQPIQSNYPFPAQINSNQFNPSVRTQPLRQNSGDSIPSSRW